MVFLETMKETSQTKERADVSSMMMMNGSVFAPKKYGE